MTETLDFEIPHEKLLHGFMLRTILRRYSYVRSELSLPAMTPRWAEAWKSESARELLVIACDAWGLAIGQLAEKAKVDQSILSSFAIGVSRLTIEQTKAVVLAMHEMVGEKSRWT